MLLPMIATLSWLKTVWEKAWRLWIKIELGPTELMPPRGQNDYWLMDELCQICTSEELIRLNRVRLHQQVIFGLDIMDAGSRSLDRKYLTSKRPLEENWSSIKFPIKKPPAKDFKLWRDSLPQLCHQGRLQMGPGHKVWDWTFDLEDSKLYSWTAQNVADIYGLSLLAGLTTWANMWGQRRIDQQMGRVGQMCTVEQVGALRNYKIISTSTPPLKQRQQRFGRY